LDFRWGSAPDPAEGAYSAPQTLLLYLRGLLLRDGGERGGIGKERGGEGKKGEGCPQFGFWHQSKGRMRLPTILYINSNFGPMILSCTVPEYGDLLAENCEFFLPHSHLTPLLDVKPIEFLDELFGPGRRAQRAKTLLWLLLLLWLISVLYKSLKAF